jgi:hypothetical protein
MRREKRNRDCLSLIKRLIVHRRELALLVLNQKSKCAIQPTRSYSQLVPGPTKKKYTNVNTLDVSMQLFKSSPSRSLDRAFKINCAAAQNPGQCFRDNRHAIPSHISPEAKLIIAQLTALGAGQGKSII